MNNIIEYYKNYEEETRLERHPLEFYTTTFILDKLIKPEHRILDVAAGTGKYALHYSKKGCTVIAQDIVPKHIEILERKLTRTQNITYAVADARDLSTHADESYDAVLCMGPLYHNNNSDSLLCLKECYRVLRVHGILVIGYINKYSGYMNDKCHNDLYFHSPDEIESIVSQLNLVKVDHVPADGKVVADIDCSAPIERIHQSLNSSKGIANSDWRHSSLHVLYIGRKLSL